MKSSSKLFSLVPVMVLALTLFAPAVHAQWVYVNDNNPNSSGYNDVAAFKNAPPLSLTAPVFYGTGGASAVHQDSLKDQALYSAYGATCLFIAEPEASSGYANGDIAAFQVNTTTGALTLVNRYANPAGNTGLQNGIALATRIKIPTLFAAYSDTNTIVSWEINIPPSSPTCGLTAKTPPPFTPATTTGFVNGMAESHNGKELVVTYLDGSIQSFYTNPGGFTLTSAYGNCASAVFSTGYSDGNDGIPAGVDITKDSKYAIFGDRSGGNTPPHGPTELEVVKLPIGCSSVTTDFGGTKVASSVSLGSYIDSTNIWLSPNEKFIYVTNNGPNAPQGFTTITFLEPAITGIASGCSLGFSNPTSLINPGAGFFEPNGIQTSQTSGSGARVYVGEYRTLASPSAVALLDLDTHGCSQEVSGSPFSNPDGLAGASQLNAVPPRPF